MEDSILQIIKEVKDLLRDPQVDLWDGTWKQNSYTEPLSSGDGFWYGLTYKKRFGEYEVSIGREGGDDNYVTFIDIYHEDSSAKVVFAESPEGLCLIDDIISRHARECLEEEFRDRAW